MDLEDKKILTIKENLPKFEWLIILEFETILWKYLSFYHILKITSSVLEFFFKGQTVSLKTFLTLTLYYKQFCNCDNDEIKAENLE